ncbi:MAG: hypothetical protein M1816_000364 [Peltula sp. TS41687]|nr:MAG: hypothetical protein M1816_000364 [Peltula sp. TS41687]
MSALTFGVELETLTLSESYGYNPERSADPGRGRRDNRAKIRTALADDIREANVPAVTAEAADAGNFDAWIVGWDASIKETNPSNHWLGFYGVEIVSRVLSASGNWAEEIDMVWAALKNGFDLKMDTSCNMHIHMRRLQPFAISDIKLFIKSAAYFDNIISSYLPKHRRLRPWAQSNFDGPTAVPVMRGKYREATETGHFDQLFGHIDGFNDFRALCEIWLAGSSHAIQFQNVVDGCGTIEFRSPPQSRNAMDTRHWIAFSLCFLQFSLSGDLGGRTRDDFARRMANAAGQLGVGNALCW